MEEKLVRAINMWARESEARFRAVGFLANWFIWLVMLAVLVFLLAEPTLRAYTISEFSEILFALLIARAFLAPLIRYAVRRKRPYELPDLRYVFAPHGRYAFPSGHATFFSAFAFAILPISPVTGWITLAAVLLNGFARVAGALHWPTDVAAGLLVGAAGWRLAIELLAWLPIKG